MASAMRSPTRSKGLYLGIVSRRAGMSRDHNPATDIGKDPPPEHQRQAEHHHHRTCTSNRAISPQARVAISIPRPLDTLVACADGVCVRFQPNGFVWPAPRQLRCRLGCTPCAGPNVLAYRIKSDRTVGLIGRFLLVRNCWHLASSYVHCNITPLTYHIYSYSPPSCRCSLAAVVVDFDVKVMLNSPVDFVKWQLRSTHGILNG